MFLSILPLTQHFESERMLSCQAATENRNDANKHVFRNRTGIICELLLVLFFFFKKKTAYEISKCDWSPDVCSSDLAGPHHRHGTSDGQNDSLS